MQQQVINLRSHPLELEDGTILAAAGTSGSTKLAELSDGDEVRLLDREMIAVREVQLKAVKPAQTEAKEEKK